ncbi:MAG: long-chain-fatty-acid--CoA ligase [Thermoleophilia bacterium]
MIVGDLISHYAQTQPESPAVSFEGVTTTYGEFDQRVSRLADALKTTYGAVKGDRLAVLSHNRPEILEVFGAAEKAGFVAVALSWRLLPHELLALIRDARPAVLFVQPRHIPTVEAIREELGPIHLVRITEPSAALPPGYDDYETLLASGEAHPSRWSVTGDDLVCLVYTSGTTGAPRAAMLTHRGQLAHARAAAREIGIASTDVNLIATPFFHVAAHAMRLAHSVQGAANAIMDSWDPLQALRAVERERATFLQLVPSQVAVVLDLPDLDRFDLSSLKTIFYASSPMPVELLRRGIAVFGPIFMQAYGQTEGGPSFSMLHKADHVDRMITGDVSRLASAGRPLPEVTVEIHDDEDRALPPGDVGEICARSPYLMTGYWGKPDDSAEVVRAGFLHTGDMGFLDDEGFVYIVDRKKDMIITGGVNVYPREIEEVLYRHPAVLEAAVIGVPDPKWVEAVKALVVLKRGKQATEAELVDFCGRHLAGYKKPKSVEFRDELPKSPAGKILKKELRLLYGPT